MKLKICVIDDVIAMRKALRRVLTADGSHTVFDFASAPEALAFLARHHVDVVVSDIFLERGSGFDVLRYVRTRPLLSDIPVLFVTGEATRDDIVAAVEGGVTDYILKPFEVAELVDKVEAAFTKYQNPGQREQLIRSAEAALLEGDTDRAREDFEAVLKLLPRSEGTLVASPRAVVGLARVDMAVGDLSAAMRRLRQVMADHPLYFPAFVLMVDSLLAQQRFGEALEILEKELEINGKQPHRRLLAANLLEDAGEPERALQHLRQALVDNPKDERLLLRMAGIYRGMGDRDKAVHYYLKTRRVARRSQEALLGLVEVCGEADEWKRARQLLTDQLNANRNAWEVYIFRARVHENMGLLDEAIADAESLLAVAPEQIEVLRLKARCLGKLGRTDQQCETLARVCSIESTHDNESKAGLAHLKASRFAGAVQHYTRAVHLDPTNTKYRFNLAYALQQIGQFDRAKAMLQTVLKLEPDHAEARDFLEKLKLAG